MDLHCQFCRVSFASRNLGVLLLHVCCAFTVAVPDGATCKSTTNYPQHVQRNWLIWFCLHNVNPKIRHFVYHLAVTDWFTWQVWGRNCCFSDCQPRFLRCSLQALVTVAQWGLSSALLLKYRFTFFMENNFFSSFST